MANLMLEPSVILSRDDGEGSSPAHEGRSRASLGMTPVDLSILIVTWNSERWIDRCLQSIPAACEGLEYEIVVHDNASEDRTLSIIGSAAANVLRSATNDGFAAGTNRAMDASRGRYVFLLNPDCALEPRALTRLFEFLETHPNVAAAAPLLIDESGHDQRHFQLRRLPTLANLSAQVLLVDKIYPKNPSTSHYRYRGLDLTEPRPIEQPAAAALLIRREVMEDVGPFDEGFRPAWFEDVDYCRRLAERGAEVWVVPAARVRHFGGASLEHMRFAKFTSIWYANMWRYARKWMRPGQAEALRWVIILGMVLRLVAGCVGLKPRGVTRGEAFRAYGNVLKRAMDRWDSPASRSSS
jgi:N-acetylglucosaminyl-diphospho-decaprenol L-rhamnosyltransferase